MDIMTDFGVLIIIWFDMINGIPAKISQPSFGTTKTVKSNGGVSSQIKYIFISPIIRKHDCWVAGNTGMPANLQIDSVIRKAVTPVSNVNFNCLPL